MAKYVFVYSGGSRPKSEAEGKAIMDAWVGYFQRIGSAVVDAGAPFGPSAKRLGGAPASGANGYSVVQADNLDAALALTKDHPHLKHGGGIEVFETLAM